MTKREEAYRKTEEEAKRELERLADQSDTLGSSAMGRMAKRASDRLNAKDVDQDDAIEVLGTRIGRGFGAIAFVVLAVYLFVTYVLN